MLVEKKTQEPLIMAIKLVTGEEIIAQAEFGNGDLKVTNPLAMVMAENPENPAQTRVLFTPWMIASGRNTVEIRESHIVGFCIARDDAAEQYRQATA